MVVNDSAGCAGSIDREFSTVAAIFEACAGFQCELVMLSLGEIDKDSLSECRISRACWIIVSGLLEFYERNALEFKGSHAVKVWPSTRVDKLRAKATTERV